MFSHSVDRAFRKFQRDGDTIALARVFDATAPELQRLARYLSRSDAPAEDLLQATYLTAIESSQRFDATQRVLPWLVGILVNHAREAKRRGRRELDPQRVRAEVGIDPTEAASTSELSQTLDAAISRLPEAQRAVLRLHLLHELEPAEIARALERSPGTVRAQLSRGLTELRRRLPRSFVATQAYASVSSDQLAAIRGLVLGKCGGATVPAASSAFLLGFLAMATSKKIALAAAVVLAACLSYTFRGALGLEAKATEPQRVVQSEVESISPPPAATVERVRDDRAPAPLEKESRETPPAIAGANTGSLVVTVVDQNDMPVPQVGVAVRSIERLQASSHLLPFVKTDEDGTVRFASLAPGHRGVDNDRGAGGEFVTIVAGREEKRTIHLSGVRVEGTVVDSLGVPIQGATIWIQARRLEGVAIATTDRRGAFEIDCVSSFVELQARKDGFTASKAKPVVGKAGPSWSVELVLGNEASELSGRVLDPTGAPVSGAVVALLPDEARDLNPDHRNLPKTRPVHVRTKEDGTYVLKEAPRGAVIVTAVGSNEEWAPVSVRLEIDAPAQRLDLNLGIGAVVEGTITDGGRPPDYCAITVGCFQPEMPASDVLVMLSMNSATTDEHGGFRMSGILPGRVEMRARRRGFQEVRRQVTTLASGETRRWDFDCAQSDGLAIDFAIEPPVSPIGRWLVEVSNFEGATPNIQSQTANAEGRAQFPCLPVGKCSVVVYVPSGAGYRIPMLEREFDAREHELTLRIPPERLRFQAGRGRLVDASGDPRIGRTVQLNSGGWRPHFSLQRTTDMNGLFDFDALPLCSYDVFSIVDGSPPTFLRTVTVAGDRAEELGDITSP